MQLAKMAWGLIRAFEVYDEYECLEAAGIDYDSDEDDDEFAECPKKAPYAGYTFDSESDGTPSPVASPSPSLPHSPCTSPATYTYELRLDEAEHEWPAIFGPGEPVRSRWLLSFGNTAALLQAKAFNLACN